MKKLTLVLLVSLMWACCEHECGGEADENTEPNTVIFASSHVSVYLSAPINAMVSKNYATPTPSCQSPRYSDSGYRVIRLELGPHTVNYETSMGAKGTITLTIREGCNSFDVNHLEAWR